MFITNESKFWLLLWCIGALALVAIVGQSLDYWKDHNTKIVQLIKDGVSPVEALCALQDDYGEHPVCIITATKNH